jgi:hypothetical protein
VIDKLTPRPRIEGVVIPQDPDKAEQVASLILEAARADVGLLRAEMTGIRSTTMAIQAELALLANKADVLKAHTRPAGEDRAPGAAAVDGLRHTRGAAGRSGDCSAALPAGSRA